jgi:raffinose/stachyose/melibiose transport system substrate-binding protein
MFRKRSQLGPLQGAETGRENKVTQESPKRRRLSRRATALIAAGLSVGTAATVAIAAPIATSSAQSAPTASIQVWMEPNGVPLDNYWAAQATAFDKANPGDSVSIDIEPTGTFNAKVATGLAGNSPPGLVFGWGGGDLSTFINSKVVQPFADAGQSDAGNPSWKSDFLASSLGAVTFNNDVYGMPVAGTQPVFFFYNKALLAKYHLSYPTTTTQLMSDVTLLAKHNVTALALSDNGGWPGLMYLEYFTDRIGGPQVFVNIQNRQKGAWSNPAIIQALKDIQTLVKANAFEQGYPDISFGTGFTEAMIHNGVAAMELMGDWDIGFFQGYYPGWVATGAMGIGFFPSVPGGKGNTADLEGNTTSYVELPAHQSAADTYVAEKFAAYAYSTPAYAQEEVSLGLVPVITGSERLFGSSPLKQYLVPVYNAVQKAPYFQYSWDKALGATRAAPLYVNLQNLFDLNETPAQFAKAMNGFQ